MNKKEFIALVMDEIESIKENATAEEIDKLNFDTFHHGWKESCIYGQMTGSCFSDRANELTPKLINEVGDGDVTFTDWKKEHYIRQGHKNFTPLEVYITLKGAKNKQVIQYLKGEINELKL